MKPTVIPWLAGIVIGLTLTPAGGQTMPGMGGNGMMGMGGSGMMGMGGNGMMGGNRPMGAQGGGVAVLPGAAAFGHRGDPARVDRTVYVTMNDNMRFTPDTIRVKAGETIRLEVHNNGGIVHDLVIGPLDQLKARAERMRQMWANQSQGGMMVLASGQTTDLVWQFDRPGSVDYACLVPGHLEAGMVGKIVVER